MLTWSKVEKRIKELVNADIYLNSNEKEEYQKWLNEEYENQKWMYDARINPDQKQVAIDEENQDIQNIEKNYKLSNGNYFHFHTNDEGYYYEIYNNFGTEIDGGLLEYSEIDNTKQSELDIRKRLAEFTDIEELANENLREVSQEFIDALESGAIAEEVGNAVLEKVENDTINAIDELKAIGQAQKVINLFKAREENGKPLNRDEYYKNQEKINYHIDNNSLGEGTPKEKVRRNIDAIKLLKKLEDKNRLANKEEQEILASYVGWGGLPDVFDESKDNWSEEYNELKEILTDEEYKSARASTLTAFYTPPVVINAIYDTLKSMGVEQANILEPSCGTGNFLGMLPQEMQSSKLYGVELDSISGKIAKQLYQKANIKVQGYEKADLPDSFFDIAIGNVPFGDFKVNDKRYDKNNFLIHDYFFAKTLDKVRPGGVIAFITSKGTMDKASPEVRKYLAQRADLLGAIRLPDNTFTKNAGTKVTSDIIFLQKRENLTDIMPDWVYLDRDENNITMNKYFVDNPDMILGKMEMVSTAYGYDSTCKAEEDTNLEEQLNLSLIHISEPTRH